MSEKGRPVDQHDVLGEEVFTYRASKDGKVFIAWHGKQVTILKGQAAAKFLRSVDGASEHEAQLAMARVTGNFKHGNER